jgi:hypothetical protein
MAPLTIAGDILWIASLSIMAGASRNAWVRMDAETRVPMKFAPDGTPLWRARRRWALTVLPVVAFFVSIALVFSNRNLAVGPDYQLILFGVRATIAALFALAHLRWLKAAMEVLEAEGALKPPPPIR